MTPQFALSLSDGVSHARNQHRLSPCGLVEEAVALFHQFGHSDEAFQAVGDRLRRFAAHSNLAARITRARDAGGARVLTETIDGGVALVLERLSPRQTVPLPNHAAWSIAAVVQGRVRYITWEPASNPATEPAARRIARDLELTAGDFVYFPESSGERHGRQAIGGDVWELRLIGREHAAWSDGAHAMQNNQAAYAGAA